MGTVNLVPATVRAVADSGVTASFGLHELRVPAPRETSLSVGQEVRLCIRPETVAIADEASRPGALLHGLIVRRAFIGDRMRYWVSVDGREWIVDQADPGAAAPLEGSVALVLRPERVHVIAE